MSDPTLSASINGKCRNKELKSVKPVHVMLSCLNLKYKEVKTVLKLKSDFHKGLISLDY